MERDPARINQVLEVIREAMQCPPEIANVIHEILQLGILRIRAFAWSNDAARCAIEADHLHNLPALLTDFRPEQLDFYLRAERIGFAKSCAPDDVKCFQSLWDSLEKYATPAKKQAG